MTIVTISYNELNSPESSPDLLEKIAQGFGSDDDCKGIVAITDVPDYSQLRRKSLHLTHALGTTPSDILQKLEDPDSYYSVGWSHGKEKLEADKYDTGKGSFYFNPLIDEPIPAILKRDFDEEMTEEKAKFIEIAKKNGAFYAPNIWPKDVLPELQSTSMKMGQLIHHVGKLLAKHCDQYVASKCDSYQENKLYDVIDKSLCCKARLLHYFPVSVDEHETNEGKSIKEQSFSDWCGWHNDHGSLTGLLPAMYFNEQGEEISCPDPDVGLYIKARNGELFHAKIPSNALAFQIGETSQIHTGGLLQATPHAVRGCDPTKDGCKGVSREAFAVFMEPEYFGSMEIPKGLSIEEAQKKDCEKHFPKNVKTLRSRWTGSDMNFGEFSEATFAAFTKMGNAGGHFSSFSNLAILLDIVDYHMEGVCFRKFWGHYIYYTYNINELMQDIQIPL